MSQTLPTRIVPTKTVLALPRGEEPLPLRLGLSLCLIQLSSLTYIADFGIPGLEGCITRRFSLPLSIIALEFIYRFHFL